MNMKNKEQLIKTYNREFEILNEKFQSDVESLKKILIKEHCEFVIGDFVRNVTGIIKIDAISFVFNNGSPEFYYHGFRYWNNKEGVLERTKDMNKSVLKFNVTKHKFKK